VAYLRTVKTPSGATAVQIVHSFQPIYHHKRESIDAHLPIVFAALAVTRYVEAATGWSIKTRLGSH
jgi:hypothetical protein